MKNCVIGVCVVLFFVFSNLSSMGVYAAAPQNITTEEAINFALKFTKDFTDIVRGGVVEEFAGSLAYDILVEWRDVYEKIGFEYGIMDAKATIDSEKAFIVVEVYGSKRNGVIEFTLFYEQDKDPVFKAYSKFSLTKWLDYTGIGAFLIIFNTIAVLVLFILYLNNQKSLPVAERNQAIDDTIARIIHNEENGHDEEGEGLDDLMEPGDESLGESRKEEPEKEDEGSLVDKNKETDADDDAALAVTIISSM